MSMLSLYGYCYRQLLFDAAALHFVSSETNDSNHPVWSAQHELEAQSRGSERMTVNAANVSFKEKVVDHNLCLAELQLGSEAVGLSKARLECASCRICQNLAMRYFFSLRWVVF